MWTSPPSNIWWEEAVASGITDILIVTGRNKEAIENHFDHSLEYYERLEKSGKTKQLEELKAIANMANISFIRQKEARGLGHAVLCAKSFVGNDPFAVLYGDDIIFSRTPVTKQLIDVYSKFTLPVVGVKQVTEEQIVKYCSLKVDNIEDNVYRVWDMIEKPTPDKVFSLLSILGRVLLIPEIFPVLEKTARARAAKSSSPTRCARWASATACSPANSRARATTSARSWAS